MLHGNFLYSEGNKFVRWASLRWWRFHW